MKLYILLLIYAHSPNFNIDPTLAEAVAHTESSFRPNAIGPVGEVGIFQVRPEFSKYTAKELLDPETNVKEGLRILSEAKKRCPHRADKTWVTCFNLGISGARKIQNPYEQTYYKRVMAKYDRLRN